VASIRAPVLTTSLVMFGLFFRLRLPVTGRCRVRSAAPACCWPRRCRRRRPREILAAKFLFFRCWECCWLPFWGEVQPGSAAEGLLLAALLVGVCGSMGVGLTIASLARTQRAASLGAMCYLLASA